MSLLSEFKGNVVLSTDTGTSTKVNKIDANLATPASSTVMSIGSNIVGGTIKIGENIENPGTLLLGNSATGTVPQQTNIVQVQGRFHSNYLRTKNNASDTLRIADDSIGGGVSIGSSSITTTVNGILSANTINSTAVLKINETSNFETAINSATTVAQNLTIGTPSFTTQYLRGTTININEFGSGNTVIGTSGGTGNITLNRPITPAYTYPIGVGNIGQIVSGTFLPSGAGLTFVTATSKTYATVSITAGTWIISGFSIMATSAGTVISQAESYLNTGTQNYSIVQNQNQSNTTGGSSISLPVNAIINVSTTTNVSQIVTVNFTGTAPVASSFEFRLQAIRIA